MPPDEMVGNRFAEVLEFCRRFLLAIANAELPNKLRPKGGASDLVQSTLAAAHEHQHQFTGQTVGELRAWLRAILTNELAMFRRRYAEAAARDVTREVPMYAAAACVVETTPVRELIRDEEERFLSTLLARLPEEFRQVVVLRIEESLPFADIGERMNRSAEAARKLFTRAIAWLREMSSDTEQERDT